MLSPAKEIPHAGGWHRVLSALYVLAVDTAMDKRDGHAPPYVLAVDTAMAVETARVRERLGRVRFLVPFLLRFDRSCCTFFFFR